MRTAPLPSLPSEVRGSLRIYRVTHVGIARTLAGCLDSDDSEEPKLRVQKKGDLLWQWEVFFHEFVHVLEREAGFELDDEGAHSQVDCVGRALLTLFLRNDWKLPGEQ